VRRLLGIVAVAVGARRGYRLLASGAVTIDLGVGRRARRLGPVSWEIEVPREVVFDVIATPYLGRTPRALESKLHVWERASTMVLAAHFTEVKGTTTTTVETVRFDRPARIDFRLVRGPVPHAKESFVLDATETGTSLTWEGELGTDFWAVGAWWGERVARARGNGRCEHRSRVSATNPSDVPEVGPPTPDRCGTSNPDRVHRACAGTGHVSVRRAPRLLGLRAGESSNVHG